MFSPRVRGTAFFCEFEQKMNRQKILARFDPDSGLKCVPLCFKEVVRPLVERLSKKDLKEYWEYRLKLVIDEIEPLTNDACHPFSKLCNRVRSVSDQGSLARLLGLKRRSPVDFDYVKWSDELQGSPAACLAAATAYWVTPIPGRNPISGLEAMQLGCTADSLRNLGCNQAAIRILENRLGLSEKDYRIPAKLQSKLRQRNAPLAGSDANNSANLILVLGSSLRLAPERGPNQAARLLECYLDLEQSDYASPVRLREALGWHPSSLQEQYRHPLTTWTLIDGLATFLSDHFGPGATNTLQLLEGFLTIESSDYDDAELLKTKLWGNNSPLSDPHFTPSEIAEYIRKLSNELRIAPSGGCERSVKLLEAVIGVSAEDYQSHESLAAALKAHGSAWSKFRSNDQAGLIRVLSSALRNLRHRGQGHSARLLEVFLGLEPDDYRDFEQMHAALDRIQPLLKTLALSTADDASMLLQTLARSLSYIADRGPRDAALLLQAHLKLSPEDLDSTESAMAVLAREDNPLRNQLACNVAIYLGTVAESLSRLNLNEEAATLVEAYLRLSPTHYQGGHNTLKAVLFRPESPLADRAMTPNAALNLVLTLAQALHYQPNRGPRESALLIECMLGIDPADYRDLVRLHSRFWNDDLRVMMFLDQNNATSTLMYLVNSLVNIPEREADGRALLEVITGGNILSYLAELESGELHLVNAMSMVALWIATSDPSAPETVIAFERVVQLVHNVRDEQLPSLEMVQDFLHHAQEVWRWIRQQMLTRIATNREAGDLANTAAEELKLLAWGEQFENRMLFERLLIHAAHGSDGATHLSGWDPDNWGLGVPWDVESMQSQLGLLSENRPGTEGQKDWRSAALTGMALFANCLRQQGHPHQLDTTSRQRLSLYQTSWGKRRPPDLLSREAVSLPALVPTGSIWVRGMFDREERLCWWACRSTGGKLEILAHGRSLPRALKRLQQANIRFDLGVERIWLQTLGKPVPASAIGTLSLLSNLLTAGSDNALLEEAVDDALLALSQSGHVSLAALGALLLLMGKPAEESSGFTCELNVWQREIELLKPWSERTEYERAVREVGQGQDTPAVRLAAAALEQRRRDELDELSRQHLAAVQRELEFAPLWEMTGENFPWNETDLIFTMPGPLLAMPLAWLDLGGEPLFRRSASTSTVCSLTLREWSAEKRRQKGPISRKLLSAHWEEPAARLHARGLPYLHHQLRECCSMKGWSVWSLGDDPRLTRGNFTAGLNDPQRQFGIVVVGGHGDINRAGVRLAPPEELAPDSLSADQQFAWREEAAHWCGDGADLSNVDLLILVACAVGRLNQEGDRDVEGLYTQLVRQGASAVIGARWPISDIEAAEFVAQMVREYIVEIGERPQLESFERARAFNRARRQVLDRTNHRRVTFHQAAAFDFYGLG